MHFEPLLLHYLNQLHQNKNAHKIILCHDESEAQHLHNHMLELANGFLSNEDVLLLPGYVQTGVYKYESAKKIIAKRLHVANTLVSKIPKIVITSFLGFTRDFPSVDWVKQNHIHLKFGSTYDIEMLLTNLNRRVYTEVQHVEDVGEYAIRGSIVDFWTPGQSHPTRLEFFDDTVQQIKSFRAYDQKSFKNLDEVYILPAREFIWPDASSLESQCEQFNNQILKQKIEGINRSNLLEDLKLSIPFPGIDDVSYMFGQVFPSFIDEFKTILAAHKNSKFDIHILDTKEEIQKSIQDLSYFYESALKTSQNQNTLVAKTNILFKGISFLNNEINQAKNEHIYFNERNFKTEFSVPEQVESLLFSSQKDTIKIKSEKIKALFDQHNLNEVIFGTKNKVSAVELLGLFSKYFPSLTEDKLESLINSYSYKVCAAQNGENQSVPNSQNKYLLSAQLLNLDGAFWKPHSKTLYISENIVRGRHVYENLENTQKSDSSNQSSQVSQIFLAAQFSDFSEGDLVVHVQHGICRFKGLATIKVADVANDFLVLEFAGNDKIYVPVNKLNLIQKYIGASSAVELDSLKTKAWTKRKEKIQKDVEQLAQKLLEHHAKQTITPGTAFSKIGEEYIAFEDAFPYEDTPDQHKATQDIMADMSLPKAMDRLLCGDVGFGKTEVAMRACYRAVLDGKQVAWLVPTTVLAHQHYRTMLERFAPFSVNVQLLDRATGAANQALEKLKKGEIDILIGTHRILSKDIQFRDLGLLVVDEEQHFGVLQKEKIKTMSYGIDVLTLTATPIPRTLQMALIGIRELSLLTTPPKSRLATKTFVCPFEDKTVVDAVNFEISRGGQIFYVHNRVEELDSVQKYLKELLPNARIAVGHGKMQQNELEKIILDFLDRKYDLFLCTTIVEAGIDMPNVNTIIVQNADNFGLSQLYQLRGRVGRRSTRGYAYFLVDSQKFSKNTEGMKRLEILKDHQELGSGFVIASHDLEMRGSGEILGDEQSGKVREIGLETYLQMLDDAIKQLGGVRVERKAEVELQIPLTLQIPESYIESARERLLMYRRFFGARDESTLINLQKECEDRFGAIPDEVNDLIEISRLRRMLLTIGAISFTIGETLTECRLDQSILQSTDEHAEAFIKRVLDLCNRREKNVRITQDGRLLFQMTRKQFLSNKKSSLDEIKKLLSFLSAT